MPSTTGSRFCSRRAGQAVRSTRSGRYWRRSPVAAAFLLPWIWAPLVVCGFAALRRGPADRERWLLVCLAAPPIIVFSSGLAVGQCAVSLGGAGLSDAAAAARGRRSRGTGGRAGRCESGSSATAGRSSCSASILRCERGPIQLAARLIGEFPARQGSEPRCGRLDLAADGPRRARPPRPTGTGRRGAEMVRCRKGRLRVRWPLPVICLGPDAAAIRSRRKPR